MHNSSDVAPSSPAQRAFKSVTFALCTLVALAATQPEFPVRLYDWILSFEHVLLTAF